MGQIEQASRAKPFLGLSLVLDLEGIASLMRETDLPREVAQPLRPGLMVDDLMDAVVRLTELLRKPAQIPVLAPLIQREIFYKILLSEQGSLLRRIASDSGRVQRVAAGLAWLKLNLDRAVRMEELAREMRMSPSAMHSWFRAVTSISPLQYQKQLRLQEACRILLTESLDAGTASRRVGYESASQFSREYRRFFGNPPMQDIAHIRARLAYKLRLTMQPNARRLFTLFTSQTFVHCLTVLPQPGCLSGAAVTGGEIAHVVEEDGLL